MATAERKVCKIYDKEFIEYAKTGKLKVGNVISHIELNLKGLVLSTYGTIQECLGEGIEVLYQESEEKISRYLHREDGSRRCLEEYTPGFADLPGVGRFKSNIFDVYKQQLQKADAWRNN